MISEYQVHVYNSNTGDVPDSRGFEDLSDAYDVYEEECNVTTNEVVELHYFEGTEEETHEYYLIERMDDSCFDDLDT